MALTITPNLNSNQFTTPKSAGLDALNAAAASGKGDDEVREASSIRSSAKRFTAK